MTGQRPRILAIDDTPANLFTLGTLLAQEFDLQIATSGYMGLTLAAQTPPDLILLDVMMPGIDGFEVCRQLKDDSKLKNIPIIFVTALTDLDSEEKGLAMGAADFITKPINVRIACQRIRNLLDRERLRKVVEEQRDILELQIVERVQTERQIAKSLSLLTATLESTTDGILVVDQDGKWILHNQQFDEIWQFTDELMAANDDIATWTFVQNQLTNATEAEGFLNKIHEIYAAPESNSFDALELKSGKIIERYSFPQRMDGEVCGRVWSFRDVTERHQSEKNLHLAASVFSHAREGIMISAADGSIVDVNEAFTRITGYQRSEVLGRNPRLLSSGQQDKAFYLNLWRDLIEKGHWSGEICNRRKSGEFFTEMQTISMVRDALGKPQHYVSLFSDISMSKAHQIQLERVAHFDTLTNLPNRVLLADRMRQAMTQAERRGQQLVVVYLDLDGFKAINDTHGHEAGDHLLIALAERMKQALREGDTLARLGGDEFVAVLSDLSEAEDSVPILTRLLAAAAKPVHMGFEVLQVSASLGVTFYSQSDKVDADQLLRQADQAMYQAKLAGKNRYHFFDAEQDRHIRGHHESVERIRKAFIEHEFMLYYQPKVNLRTGAVIGVEALIRWRHPDKGILAPAVFLPVIEDHLLAIELGEWVINTALNQLSLWQAAGLNIPVSVNIGARQLQQANFVERLQKILAEHPHIEPSRLELEVLETSALEDLAHVSQVIESCRQIGVTFALDDFGTGYSSLTYLKRLQVVQLKIDQSFVHDMLDNPDDLAILEGVIGLASAFRRQVIAEGVETVAHGAMLLQLQCELAQGYGIAHPMPAADLPSWVAAWRTDPSWADMQAVDREDMPMLFASIEHRAWIKATTNYLKGEQETPPSLDHDQCHFGQWLKNVGANRYDAQPSFVVLNSLHQQAHLLAAELCKLRSEGHSQIALNRLDELLALHDALIEEIKKFIKLSQN